MVDASYPEMFRRRAERDPHRRALTFDGQTWTYAQICDGFERLASGFAALGVRRGDRVVYAGLNHPNLILAMFATMDLGAVFAPVDPRFAAPEREWVIADLRPTIIVVAEEFKDSFAASAGTGQIVSADGAAGLSIDGLVAGHQSAPRMRHTRSDVALVLYTSGTTGFPKGVIHTHEMILANGINLARMMGTQRDDVGLVMTPMFHTAGFNTSPVNMWAYGGEVVLLPRMDGPAALAAIVKHRVTRIDTVTAALNVLYNTPGFADSDLTSIRSLNVGGAPIPAEQVERFRRHGAQIYMAVGMTECPVACALAPEKVLDKPGSVGTPLALLDYRLVNAESGVEITVPDTVGELCLRGPSVASGYWNNPDATAAAFAAGGWYRTGDLARVDDDGDLYLVGRTKDVIKTGGESVAAAEVERVVAQHPSVKVCAMIGAPHERWGETIVAVVQLDVGRTLDLDQLRSFCEPHLARFKLPTRLIVVDDIPMTASGKVAKPKLRSQLNLTAAIQDN